MVVTAIVGVIGLATLTSAVTRPHIERLGTGIIVRRECVRIWLHPALYELAGRLSDQELRSQDAFARNTEQPGLTNAWYVITIRLIQADGKDAVVSSIHHPFQTGPAFSSEFPDVLATAAGRPPRTGPVDYSAAEVGVVPERLLSLDPRAAFDELQTFKSSTGREEAP
jgi:hypothetical protein